ncbi:MAG: NAD(P)/FAD-dependent oxidoreductase [Pseudomonadota bacterium]|nr:NAD(P)/FAD-dependent oxidoreductase [Pseudomonadota bacterium]
MNAAASSVLQEPPFDLAIVGAGFAGLAAARSAALRGLRVAVLEAKPAIGVRMHTTGIFVREAADAYDIPLSMSRRVTRVRLYGPRRQPFDLEGPGYYFLTTDTAAVMRWLGEEAARAGAHIRTHCRFEGAERNGDMWRIRAGGEAITARYLLGADGARSPTAKALGLSANRRFIAGVEREYLDPGLLDPGYLHCFLDSRTAPGYIAWAAVSPIGAQIGLAVSDGRRPKIDAFTREAEQMFRLDPARAKERRAGLIPCGGVVPRWSREGAMLVGDAAGMVSPLTGGGIHPALSLGRRAGQAIADHLRAGAVSPERTLAGALPNYGLKLIMRRALDTAPPNWLLDMALSTTPMATLARRVFFHGANAFNRSETPALATFEREDA